MTYTGGEFSTDALFRELSKRAMLERIDIYEAYAELVDALIEEKKSYGFLSDEEDLQQIKRDLLARWPRLQNMLAESGILMLP